MKKISVWKVVLLTIVTLGLYSIYWAARNRDYIKQHDKKAGYIPAWGWLVVIPAAGFVLLGSIITLMIIATFGALSADSTLLIMNVLASAYTVLALAVGIWWVAYFAKPMEKVTHGSITRAWAVALYIFTGPLLVAFYQFYINKSSEEKAASHHEPSSVFMFFAIGAMALSLISTVISTADYIRSIPSLRIELQQAQESTKVLMNAYREYALCDSELLQAYPDGKPTNPEQQAAYTLLVERCEGLNAEYQRALDAI